MFILALATLVLTQPPAPAADPKAAEGTLYLVVPLKGVFGQEITAPGIRDAIRAAKAKKASAVVLTLDSPGGRVADADAIAAVMDKERGDLKYYAVVTRAISASMWPLSRCDSIFFAPGAAAGAAVAFSIDSKSGNAEVDAKFNAAKAAMVSGAAESHGQSGAAYRAMMIKDAKLFGWSDAKGEYHLGDAAPPDAKDIEQLDSENTVLAWTAEQAVKYHFGKVLPSADPAAIGDVLREANWRSAGDGGPQAMSRWAKEIERKAKDTEKALENIKTTREAIAGTADRAQRQAKVAEAADPGAGAIKIYYTGSGTFTPATQTLWRDQTDKAINEWRLVQSLLADLDRAERRAAQAVDDFNKARDREFQARLITEKPEPLKVEPFDHGLDVPMFKKLVGDAIDKLNASRMKTHL